MKQFRSFLKKRRSSGADAKQANPQPTAAAIPKFERAAQQPINASAQSNTLTVALQNQTNSNTVHAYITGRAIDNNNAWFLLQSDAVTPYYPASPDKIMQPLGADCAIRLGGPGSTIQAQMPVSESNVWSSTLPDKD